MTTVEAYELGFELGQLARIGEIPIVSPLQLSIPTDMRLEPSLVGAYRLGYQTGIIGKRIREDILW